MKIVIIEDERVVAEDLAASIIGLLKEPVDIVQLHSVRESVAYFKSAPAPDMIFSDIQLGDGLSFEIFIAAPLTVPVIFCTAFDEYALDAFKANGIDYILKPFTTQTLERALNKYNQFKQLFAAKDPSTYSDLMQLLTNKESAKAGSILVYYQDKIMPVKLNDIALFYLENNITHLLTFTGKTYYPNKTLDDLEKMTGNHFFRANRQYLVCRKAIVEVSKYFSRKLYVNLTIPFKDKVTVSKGKAAEFLQWLTEAG